MNKKFLKMSIIFGLAVFLSACQSPSEKVIEKVNEKAIEDSMGGNTEVDLNEGNINIETENGTMQAGQDVSLPDNFPSDVYVYEGKLAAVVFNEANNGFNLTIETKDVLDDIKSVYENKLEEDGWVVNQSMNLGGVLYLGAEKNGRVISITASQTDETTMLVINVGNK